MNNNCSCIESSYAWTDLTQGEYQFSVIAYTGIGPGETASLMISTLPNNGMLIIIVTLKNATKIQEVMCMFSDTYIINFRSYIGNINQFLVMHGRTRISYG